MTAKPKLHGWIPLDKPEGLTSTQAMNRAKRALKLRKVGHGGTLDPMASGLLPLAVGEATKTVGHIMDGVKTYRFTVRFGQARDTDDAEGEVTEESADRPETDAIREALPAFEGEIMQVPPTFSAVKVDGRRAYDIAREGGDPRLEARPVYLESVELLTRADADHVTFACVCGKGFYVRALARDLGRALGVPAHLSGLRRTQVGVFSGDQMVPLAALEDLGDPAEAASHLMPVATALADIPALAVTPGEAKSLRNGQGVSVLKRTNIDTLRALDNGDTVLATSEDRPVAITQFEAGSIRPVRVLNL
mgnify:CR=1 FL=1